MGYLERRSGGDGFVLTMVSASGSAGGTAWMLGLLLDHGGDFQQDHSECQPRLGADTSGREAAPCLSGLPYAAGPVA